MIYLLNIEPFGDGTQYFHAVFLGSFMSVYSLVFSLRVCVCLEALLSPVFQFYVYDLFPRGSLRREMCELWKVDRLARSTSVCVCAYVLKFPHRRAPGELEHTAG